LPYTFSIIRALVRITAPVSTIDAPPMIASLANVCRRR
jgi:hypothetical protein